MAPGITDIESTTESFVEVKTNPTKLEALKATNGFSNHGETDGQQMSPQSDTETYSSAKVEEDAPLFTMPSMHKLREAQRRVENDFRSDTVTVPTVNMFQVSISRNTTVPICISGIP